MERSDELENLSLGSKPHGKENGAYGWYKKMDADAGGMEACVLKIWNKHAQGQ